MISPIANFVTSGPRERTFPIESTARGVGRESATKRPVALEAESWGLREEIRILTRTSSAPGVGIAGN
jgi:hypothetical protein